jgi:hypothetical protein
MANENLPFPALPGKERRRKTGAGHKWNGARLSRPQHV